MIRLLALAALAVVMASPATAGCLISYCKSDSAASSTPSTRAITNTHRQRIGDIYNPGAGRRVQIRDTDRRIIGYIERDGSITNTNRQPVANIGTLRD